MRGQGENQTNFPALPEWTRNTGLAAWNRFAAVNDEFIDLHMSDRAAVAAGQRAVFGMGNLRVSYYYAAIEHGMASDQRIREFTCRFTALNFEADTLTVRSEPEACRSEVRLTLSMPNQDGVETTPGAAVIGVGYSDPDRQRKVGALTPSSISKALFLDNSTLGLVGKELPTVYSYPVDANDIRRWSQAVWYPETSPHGIPAEGYERDHQPIRAPGDFNPFAWHPTRRTDTYPWMRGMGTEPGFRGLNGGLKQWHHGDIHVGDVISSTVRLVDAYEKVGSTGPLLFLVDEDTWENQDQQIVRISQRTTVYY